MALNENQMKKTMDVRKSVLSAITTLVFVFAFTAGAVQAQMQGDNGEQSFEEGSFLLGPGMAVDLDIGEYAIGVNSYYSITDDIRAGAELMYYLEGTDGLSLYDINLNGHYLFTSEDNFRIYGLGGLNNFTVNVDGVGSSSDLGINLGGGFEYLTGSAVLFAEPKIVAGDGTRLNLAAGVRFEL